MLYITDEYCNTKCNIVLLQLLNGKFSGSGMVTAAAKGRCWDELAKEVSAVSGIMRTAADIKKKWIHMKSEAKGSVAAVRRGLKQTGGGEMVESVTASQQRIVDVIGEVCVEGLAGGIDTAELKFLAGMYRR